MRIHYRWIRRRVGYHRPKTPAPKNGWLLGELARLTELPETTVRYYLLRRVIEPIEVRGTATRYERYNLLRLLGILRLKVEEHSTLEEKKRKLAAMGQQELERWERIALLPGLELLVRADAREPARLVAQRICEEYSVK